ncbi:MAG: ABC transporter ATP-binding protein [Puniceicoccales bacterium]|jgi:predicted ABC-type transport system involved in lysophospholipase L1 biosynthesis ATPase subunit|nr:ABC transporter ATP-binding protein [Puniceicoccales bacterium]
MKTSFAHNAEPSPAAPSPPQIPVLSAVGLAKSFRTPRGMLPVIADVTLSVGAGEFASIRGGSGAGKTTLLQILGGLDRPDAGELYWGGELVSGRGNAFLAVRRATRIGFVFQAYHLVPELSALENILLAARIAGRDTGSAKAEALGLLDRVGLAERATHLPGQLSGGECQRVALVRALINRPPLILADEPTGNLDERTGEEIMSLLLDLTRTASVALVLVTHNADFASRAGRRFILRGGVLTLADAGKG